MKKTVRVAAVADLHYHPRIGSALHNLFAAASEAADVLLLCGDLTNCGHVKDARPLARDLQAYVDIPVLAVLGNHDYDSGQAEELIGILEAAGVKMLDGEGVELEGVGFAGICGFGGGFGPQRLNGTGDPVIDAFIAASEAEVQSLDRALAGLKTSHRVVLLHYAPVRETVAGEEQDLYPVLGSSRLEKPLNQHRVTVVFHGHAHHGAPEGSTATGIPIYNVSIPVLRAAYPDQPAFRVFEVAV